MLSPRSPLFPCRGVPQESSDILGCSGQLTYCWWDLVSLWLSCWERGLPVVVPVISSPVCWGLVSCFSGEFSFWVVGETRIFRKEWDLVNVEFLPRESRFLRVPSGVGGGRF